MSVNQPILVSVFATSSFLGTTTVNHFRTNGGAEALQNGSVAGFCPFCGELWLRAVHERGLPYWRTAPVPCLTHANLSAQHNALWGNFAWLFPITTFTSPELLQFELLWWARRLISWAEN